jgi:PIN domain nuclease of toxin-antitoxin system
VRLLLDTCTFLWLVVDAPELSPLAREALRDAASHVSLSAVSAWEISIKHALGRLPLPEAPQAWLPSCRERHGIEALPLGEDAALRLATLPQLHRDPFDRMLVCQAIEEGLVLVTPDPAIRQYAVKTLW